VSTPEEALKLDSSPEPLQEQMASSRARPGFPLERVADFILQRKFSDELTFIGEFRSWCRAQKKP
jgi:hypothetical protein